MINQNPIIEKIIKEINSRQKFILGTHVFPDGDNLGSIIAMHLLLTRMGKSTYLYCETPIPKIYSWLPGIENLTVDLPTEMPSDFDTLITLDSGDINRLGPKFISWLEDSMLIINIDHHITNTGYGDINWVDSTYSAVGEQVFEITKALGMEVALDMAIALFTAIYTDTGRFSYSNTNARTLHYASELVDLGVNPNMVFRRVYAGRSLATLNMEREALNTLTYDPEMNLAYIYLTSEMVERSGAEIEDSEGIIEHVATFGESIKNLIFFKETVPGEIKVSIRTKGQWDASKIAMLFGGGGHPQAGGYSMRGSMDEVISLSIEIIRKEGQKGRLNITINTGRGQ